MHLDENITPFDKAGQQAITRLFSHLQDAHNHMSQVAQAVVQLSKVSSPEQFTFVLKTCSQTHHPIKNSSTFISTNRTQI